MTQEQEAHVAELVAALRSGEYEQTTGSLRDQVGFCCLGVACHLSGIAEWREVYLRPYQVYGDEHAAFELPEAVMEYYGFTHPSGSVKYTSIHSALLEQIKEIELDHLVDNDGFLYLAELNDQGVPFSLIADIIEAEPEGLFV